MISMDAGPLNWQWEIKQSLYGEAFPITVKDLRAGNTVSVTYTGEVLEISPAQVRDVLRIQLLDDETPY